MRGFIELVGVDILKYCINIDDISMVVPNIDPNGEVSGTKIYLRSGQLHYFKESYDEVLNEIETHNEYR